MRPTSEEEPLRPAGTGFGTFSTPPLEVDEPAEGARTDGESEGFPDDATLDQEPDVEAEFEAEIVRVVCGLSTLWRAVTGTSCALGRWL
jgi:hypothetical protein